MKEVVRRVDQRPARVRWVVLSGLLAAVTAVCSLLAIPNPFLPAVPFTLQVFAVCLAAAVLPPRWAFASQAVYLLLGAIGIPVFAGGAAGPAILVSVTGGFLWGYPFAAALGATVAGRGGGFWRLGLGALACIVVIYVFGYAGMLVFGRVPLDTATLVGLLTFLPWDLVKGGLAAAVALRARRILGPGEAWSDASARG
jgi:biotin transport system substrate-specific component